ncbi:P63C domain-containing protein [Hymenobacter monticola]|uniref:P63C domain-containing protein n=1 Tax=Hymenobacter monticola TaxID=1705399 RepID=A0ABY4BFG4_9BACT|nr:P63C domain-containing protein [Hymenobacter monticola]UOE36481.1 P63C domain-containing protein [Hymenobacter monticola]
MKKAKKTNAPAETDNLASPGLLFENLRNVEISHEEKLERSLLSGLLLQQTDTLNRQRLELKKQRDHEAIELLGGSTTSLGTLKALIAAKRQPYEPRFPRSIPFFSEIYRLNGWHHLDPAYYIKPDEVGIWINELIYNRFSQEVLSTLRMFNPKRTGGGRLYKHF